jgi:hypothetical protein
MKRKIRIRDKKIKKILKEENRKNVKDDFFELLRRAVN